MTLKKCVFLFLLVFGFNSFAADASDLIQDNGLPFETDLTKIKLGKISEGRDFVLDYQLSIPETQKINKGAPSHVTIFEKDHKSKVWKETKRIKLSGMVNLMSNYNFSETIALNSDSSDIAIHSTIYHCGKQDTRIPCFIQGFQGFIFRDKHLKNKNKVVFKVKATVY